MKIVALIPIKLNSERVPHKNLLPIGSKPLCYHLPNTLLSVDGIDEIYVYCSDEKVVNYIPNEVIFLKRDKKLDDNMTKGKDIYDSFINEVDADIYILAHTTSPFTKKETIQDALNKVIYEGYDSAFTAQRIQTFSWYNGKPINYDLDNIPRTQDIEPIFVETSAFFIFKKELWVKYGRRIGFNPFIKEVDQIEAIEIDTKEQYDFANIIAKNILKI